jgi:hypothetical protein
VSSLWDRADFLRQNFIPVALNGDAGSRPDMVAKFFAQVARHFANEVAVVTPNARLLSHASEAGLEKWQQLPAGERKRLEDFGSYDAKLDPEPPAGGLMLNVYARGLARAAQGRLQIYRTKVARSLEPGRDHLWLTAAEAKALMPAQPHKGQQLIISTPVVDRICRRYLIDLVRVGGNGGPRRPEEVLEESMQLTIQEVTPHMLHQRLDGSARLATHDPASGARGKEGKVDTYQLLGFLAYDRQAQVFKRFDMVALSETGHYDEIHGKTLPLGIAFELARGQTPMERFRPSSFGKDYFAERKRQR